MQFELEQRLLAAAASARPVYEEIFSKVKPEEMSEIGRTVAELIQQFYDIDREAFSVPKETLLERVRGTLRGEAAADYIGSLDPRVSALNVLHDVKHYRRQKIGETLIHALVNGGEEKYILEKMTAYQDVFLEETQEDEQIFVGAKVSDLVNNAYNTENLIKLLPKELNDRVDGGCRPGHHIVVYARPEIGKTLIVINMTAGFLLQGLRVLYVGNEDPASDILLRTISRLAKMTKQEIIVDPEEAETRAFARGYQNLTVAALSPGNFFEIRKLVEKFQPKVVILDQLRNLDVNSESRVQGLEKAATEARNLAKRYGLVVVSVTQAGESAERKAILDRSDIDFSKTGIPATADLMVGIGADESMEKHGLRTISLPKNKLSGNHEYFTVRIHPALGLVESS